MNFTVSSDKLFKQIHSYTVLVQGISTIVTEHMPAFHVLRKVHYMLASEFSVVYHIVTCLKNEKALVKVALR